MRRLPASVAVAATLCLAPPVSATPAPTTVAVDRTTIKTAIGGKFRFGSTITNRAGIPAANLVAHLNVLSLRTGTYVDPEDWSSHRTRYLAPIPPGGSITLDWRMQAVNSGDFGVYVAVLHRSGVPRPPVTGPTIHVEVATRKTLNSGGILPLALGIPAALGLLLLGIRSRRRSSA